MQPYSSRPFQMPALAYAAAMTFLIAYVLAM